MKTAYRIIFIQSLIAVLAVAIWFGASNVHAAVAALLAAVACILPNLVFARLLFAHQGARQATKIVKSFYRAEMVKILLTIVVFFVGIKVLTVPFLPFLLTYIVCQLAIWSFPWLDAKSLVWGAAS